MCWVLIPGSKEDPLGGTATHSIFLPVESINREPGRPWSMGLQGVSMTDLLTAYGTAIIQPLVNLTAEATPEKAHMRAGTC